MTREFEDAILSTSSSVHSDDEQQPESPVCSTGDQCSYGGFKAIQGEGWSVKIRQTRKGFRCNAMIDAELPISPDQAFDLLTDPEVKQWRQVKVIIPVVSNCQDHSCTLQIELEIVLYTQSVSCWQLPLSNCSL